jgi:hypothetical protein
MKKKELHSFIDAVLAITESSTKADTAKLLPLYHELMNTLDEHWKSLCDYFVQKNLPMVKTKTGGVKPELQYRDDIFSAMFEGMTYAQALVDAKDTMYDLKKVYEFPFLNCTLTFTEIVKRKAEYDDKLRALKDIV